MKRWICGMLTLVILLTCAPIPARAAELSGDGVPMNPTTFPDPEFREYVQKVCDQDRNGVLSQAEREAVSEISVPNRKITTLEGLEQFPNLTRLDASDNQLTVLDLGKNSNLREVNCRNNVLTGLNLSGCGKLTDLDCGGNRLSRLELKDCGKLSRLNCEYNQLTALDVSGCEMLFRLDCGSNQLSALDLSGCKALTSLSCSGNVLEDLSIRDGPRLSVVD